MEAILLIGLPASGKSTYYKRFLFNIHVRLSLDLLRTRHREQRMLEVCIETQARLCVDNTNASRAERSRYIEPLRTAGYTIHGYYFESKVADCLARNALRQGRDRIPDAGVLGTAGRLELPQRDEGFDRLFYVRLAEGEFLLDDWQEDKPA